VSTFGPSLQQLDVFIVPVFFGNCANLTPFGSKVLTMGML
jgi:hypothetical protein